MCVVLWYQLKDYYETLLPRLKIYKNKSKEGVVERVSITIYRPIHGNKSTNKYIINGTKHFVPSYRLSQFGAILK